jgi:hypothetical protein
VVKKERAGRHLDAQPPARRDADGLHGVLGREETLLPDDHAALRLHLWRSAGGGEAGARRGRARRGAGRSGPRTFGAVPLACLHHSFHHFAGYLCPKPRQLRVSAKCQRGRAPMQSRWNDCTSTLCIDW